MLKIDATKKEIQDIKNGYFIRIEGATIFAEVSINEHFIMDAKDVEIGKFYFSSIYCKYPKNYARRPDNCLGFVADETPIYAISLIK